LTLKSRKEYQFIVYPRVLKSKSLKEVKESKTIIGKTYQEYSIEVKSVFKTLVVVIMVRSICYHVSQPFELFTMPIWAYIAMRTGVLAFRGREIEEDTIPIAAMVFHSKTDFSKSVLEEDKARDMEIVRTMELIEESFVL